MMKVIALSALATIAAAAPEGCNTSGTVLEIGTRTVVAVQCNQVCSPAYPQYDKDHCQEVALTEVPTFVNKDVTEIDLSGEPAFGYDVAAIYNSITIVRAGAFQNLLKLVTIALDYNIIVSIEANAFSNLPQVTAIRLEGNAITSIEANSFSNLPQLTTLELQRNSITSIEANSFSNLPQLTTLFLYMNAFTIIAANSFSNLLQLTTLELYANAITSIEAEAFSDLLQLKTLKLNRNLIISIEANAFSNLPKLEELDLEAQEYDDRDDGGASLFALSKSPDVVRFCEEGIISAEDRLCVDNHKVPGQTAFLAAAVAVDVLIALILIALLHKKSGVTRWDVLHVAFFCTRIFDLMMDWGMFGFTMHGHDWDEVMEVSTGSVDQANSGVDVSECTFLHPAAGFECGTEPLQFGRIIKYMSLAASIFGTLLFIPDIFVFARKIGLAQKLGGCFNWYKPSRNASAIVTGLTLLLESIPQLFCAYYIIDNYAYAGSLAAQTIAIISAASSAITILTDTLFFSKLCCGHTKCCSCWCKCCHCDVSKLYKGSPANTSPSGVVPFEQVEEITGAKSAESTFANSD